MRLWIILSSILILYFSYGVYLSQSEVAAFPPHLPRENSSNYYDYRGVINVHTNLSSGSSSPAQVLAAANMTGLDFIMLTDLNYFEPYPINESYHGHTLVMIGQKVSYLDSRFIYYNPHGGTLGDSLGEAQVKLADMLSQAKPANSPDDLVILAHPFKAGFSWNGPLPTGLDGFELLNEKSLSQRSWEMSKASTLWSLLMYPFNPHLAFLRLFFEPTDEIDLFDPLSRQRSAVAFAGAEASARALPFADYLVKFPSYQRSFEFLTDHVLLRSELTGSADGDRLKIFNALKKGNFYMCLELLGDPKGFNVLLDDHGKSMPMGTETKLSKDMKLVMHLPSQPLIYFEIVVYRNGQRYETFNQTDAVMPVKEPGSYRVQVRLSPTLPLPDGKRWITWIYTNPFRITNEKGAVL